MRLLPYVSIIFSLMACFCRVLTAVFFGAMAVSQNSSFAPDYAEAKVAAARLFTLFDQKPNIDSSSDKGCTPVRLF